MKSIWIVALIGLSCSTHPGIPHGSAPPADSHCPDRPADSCFTLTVADVAADLQADPIPTTLEDVLAGESGALLPVPAHNPRSRSKECPECAVEASSSLRSNVDLLAALRKANGSNHPVATL